MHIRLSAFLALIALTTTMASNYLKTAETFPHEWNKAAYYERVNNCPYPKECSSTQYYSNRTRRCAPEPPDWSPQYKLNGRYQSPSSRSFMEINTAQYKVNWISEDDTAHYIFNGRYLNQTMFTGLEITLLKRSNCIRLQQFDFSVVAHRHFCRSRVTSHWYTPTCELPPSENKLCFVY